MQRIEKKNETSRPPASKTNLFQCIERINNCIDLQSELMKQAKNTVNMDENELFNIDDVE